MEGPPELPPDVVFPMSVRAILVSELAERFAYYGTSALLPTFLSHAMGFDESVSIAAFFVFDSICYCSPLYGGYKADSSWGKYKTIIRLSLVYILGTALLSVAGFLQHADQDCIDCIRDTGDDCEPCSASTLPMVFMMLGLLLIGIGTGGIKPCVSSFGADQLPKSGEGASERVSKYFRYFYLAINVGSVMTYLVIPNLQSYFEPRVAYSYGVGFAPPAVLLTVATLIVWLGRRLYYHSPLKGSMLTKVFTTVRDARRHRPSGRRGGVWVPGCCMPCGAKSDDDEALLQQEQSDEDDEDQEAQTEWVHFLDWALRADGADPLTVADVKSFYRVMPVFATLPVFWMLFGQISSAFVLQADKMDRNFFGWEMPPAMMQVVNPLTVVSFIPLFDKVVYPVFRWLGVMRRDLGKMTGGMLVSALAFVAVGLVQKTIDESALHSVHVLWQVPQLVLLTSGEIMVSVVGLEFAYSQAPVTMKSTVTAFFLLTKSIGSMFGAIFFLLLDKVTTNAAYHYWFFSALCLVNMLVLLLVRTQYRYRDIAADAVDADATLPEDCAVLKAVSPHDVPQTLHAGANTTLYAEEDHYVDEPYEHQVQQE
ncbi:MAG: hypothetical protein MHM6MM_000171 [Cercozoa sp. M6MM]